MQKALMLAAALLVAAPASAQVYKCTVNGSTVSSGTPCERGAKTVDLGNTSASGNVSAADAKRQSRFRRLIQLKQVAIGMTAQQVRYSWGEHGSIACRRVRRSMSTLKMGW